MAPQHEILIPFSFGELWAGSNGMKCQDCGKITWIVWLTKDELDYLSKVDRELVCLKICQEKLGFVLCNECVVNFNCEVNPYYSGICSKGTKCCREKHAKISD